MGGPELGKREFSELYSRIGAKKRAAQVKFRGRH